MIYSIIVQDIVRCICVNVVRGVANSIIRNKSILVMLHIRCEHIRDHRDVCKVVMGIEFKFRFSSHSKDLYGISLRILIE